MYSIFPFLRPGGICADFQYTFARFLRAFCVSVAVFSTVLTYIVCTPTCVSLSRQNGCVDYLIMGRTVVVSSAAKLAVPSPTAAA